MMGAEHEANDFQIGILFFYGGKRLQCKNMYVPADRRDGARPSQPSAMV